MPFCIQFCPWNVLCSLAHLANVFSGLRSYLQPAAGRGSSSLSCITRIHIVTVPPPRTVRVWGQGPTLCQCSTVSEWFQHWDSTGNLGLWSSGTSGEFLTGYGVQQFRPGETLRVQINTINIWELSSVWTEPGTTALKASAISRHSDSDCTCYPG